MENSLVRPSGRTRRNSATWNSSMEPTQKRSLQLSRQCPVLVPTGRSKPFVPGVGRGSIGRKSRALRLGENQCWITTGEFHGLVRRIQPPLGIRRMKPISSKINPEADSPSICCWTTRMIRSGGYFGETLFDYGTQHLRAKPSTSYTLTLRPSTGGPAYRSNPK